jgi:hypothetical protein
MARDVDVRDWFYWPTSAGSPVPWLIALLAYGSLAFFSVRNFTVFAAAEMIDVPFWTLAALSSILNGALLWLQMRSMYLTWRMGFRPWLATWATFSLAFPFLWAVGSYLRGSGAPWVTAAGTVDMAQVTRGLFVGEAGFTALLLLSAIWKPDDIGANGIRRQRTFLKRLFVQLKAKRSLDAVDITALDDALKFILTEAPKVMAHVVGSRQAKLLRTWTASASAASAVAAPLDASDLKRVERLRDDLVGALEDLRREK